MKPIALAVLLSMPLVAVAQEAPPMGPVTLQTPAEAAAALSDREAVRAVVVALFDAMQAADTSAARATLHDRVTMLSVVPDPAGGTRLAPGDAEAFLAALGQSDAAAPWTERIGPISVEVDGDLAQAWMDYAFYLGDAYSHCGVNAMQLVRADGAWQILNIVDTRRPACGQDAG